MFFSLFGHLMQKVYTPTRPRMTTIEELIDRIYLYFWELSPALCKSWTNEFYGRLRLVISEDGGNIEHIVNKI